ncbi:hypothetical protein [Ichthyenterobacterium magnum]|uniref:PH (Pleckstrin Homology) domain-containing protein n=1 Tax=Ichthyenterobacterium magnum TaxID=1230530 RepID=A0A420DXD8_9FLAO|nr:hypothetical protein [Ichthyenterobacterium magnum]RKE98879.1 hypothetical protein BXY80_0974 [Ichthyenterobacterium magnum]
MKIQFVEKQKFTQWWIWLILIGLGLFTVFGIVKQLILKEPFGDKPMSNIGIIIFSIFIFGFIYFTYYITLITQINNDGIKMRFVPFIKKEIKWNELKSAKIVNYGFVGYGIRLGSTYGTVYNINGNKGLALELTNGKKFVIGTQKHNELKDVIEKYLVS